MPRRAGGQRFAPDRINTKTFRITENNVLPLLEYPYKVRKSIPLGPRLLRLLCTGQQGTLNNDLLTSRKEL